MESILEIKDSCDTSEQLLRSYAFARYLKIYKKEYLEELEKKGEKHSEEAKQKMELIANLTLKDIFQVFEREAKGADLEKDRAIVRFLDGCYHHYRNKSFSRLVRMHNEIVTSSLETQSSIKSKISDKAEELSELIILTRRKLLDKVGLGHGVSRSHGLDASPNEQLERYLDIFVIYLLLIQKLHIQILRSLQILKQVYITILLLIKELILFMNWSTTH